MPIVNVKMLQGVKITPEDAKSLDPARQGQSSLAPPPSAEVEVQWSEPVLATCPWCGHVAWTDVDTHRYDWYRCEACGLPFKP